MPDTLPVNVSDPDLHAIDVADSFETTGTFVVELRNHARAVHVHLNLEGALARVASLEATNHFVETRTARRITVQVRPVDEPVEGRLKLVTGYGAEEAFVDVRITPPEESASEPAADSTDEGAEPTDSEAADDRRRDQLAAGAAAGGGSTGTATNGTGSLALHSGAVREYLPLAVLAAVALALALLATTVAPGLQAVLGVGAVIAGIVLAVALLRR